MTASSGLFLPTIGIDALSFHRVAQFFSDNTPDLETLAIGGPIGLVWAGACLALAGVLKRRVGLQTGYTRKIFHFLIFTSVIAIHGVWGTPCVCLFGGMTSLVVGYAVLCGPGHLMYEAMAREKDEPRRTHYIVVPFLATLIGGVLSNILFPATAVLGYLVTGLGDAVAEPVGTRFGRHRYSVPAIGGVKAIRTIEGSCAVFAASVLSLALWFAFTGAATPGKAWLAVAVVALVSTLVEAISPHGWDNATLQLVPAMLGAALL